MPAVLGASASRAGWVEVRLEDGHLAHFARHAHLAGLLATDAQVIAVDVPLAEGVADALRAALGRLPAPAPMRVAEARAARDPRLHEAHAELSFQAMRGAPLAHPPHTWAGIFERIELLRAAGLRPARVFGGVGLISPQDVLAASALAWTARRIATGAARALPQAAVWC
ncbi:MAG: DUF429 domain-containing protein [Halobacteriales archaeon]|nr:DUF429 domain-containing protein [Halobacteriales archaeon]